MKGDIRIYRLDANQAAGSFPALSPIRSITTGETSVHVVVWHPKPQNPKPLTLNLKPETKTLNPKP